MLCEHSLCMRFHDFYLPFQIVSVHSANQFVALTLEVTLSQPAVHGDVFSHLPDCTPQQGKVDVARGSKSGVCKWGMFEDKWEKDRKSRWKWVGA